MTNATGPLLEREAPLAELHAAARAAAAGAGRVVFVAGDAGLGKTALVREFARRADVAQVLIGTADDLSTPRALGAIRDVLDQVPPDLRADVPEGSDGEQVLATLLRLAASSERPVVFVVEDAHWADDATFDVVRYMARRIRELPLVLVLTYREQVALGHPLRSLLGSVRGPDVSRLVLVPLTANAVATLAADAALDADEIFRTTGGNPLFVSEVIAAPSATLPDTVRDAVLARLGNLAPGTVDSLQRLAVVPNRIDRTMARELVAGGEAAWTEAERAGMLDGDADHVWFRHELVRRAVEETLTPSESVLAHRRVASLVHARGGEASRVVHHAALGSDVDLVLAAGPVAAAEAQRAGAHRQVAMHLGTVLAHADRLPAAQRASMFTERAHSLYLINRFDESTECARRGVAAAEEAGDDELLARALLTFGRTELWARGPRSAVEVERAGPRRARRGRGPRAARGRPRRPGAGAGRTGLGRLGPAGQPLGRGTRRTGARPRRRARARRPTRLRAHVSRLRTGRTRRRGRSGRHRPGGRAVAHVRPGRPRGTGVRERIGGRLPGRSVRRRRALRRPRPRPRTGLGVLLRPVPAVAHPGLRACELGPLVGGRGRAAHAAVPARRARHHGAAGADRARPAARPAGPPTTEATQVLVRAEMVVPADEIRVVGPVTLARIELAWLSGSRRRSRCAGAADPGASRSRPGRR